MPEIKSKGAFRVTVPSGWSVTGKPDKEYNMWPTDDTGLAVNITVLPPRPVSDAARNAQAIRDFAKTIGVDEPGELTITTRHARGEIRSFATIHRPDWTWFVASMFFRSAFVLATVTARPNHVTGLEVGKKIVEQIRRG